MQNLMNGQITFISERIKWGKNRNYELIDLQVAMRKAKEDK